MGTYTIKYECEKLDGLATAVEVRRKVYERVLTNLLEQESAGDFYDDDRREYGLSPEECAREAANFHIDYTIYGSIDEGLNKTRKTTDRFAFRYRTEVSTKESNDMKERIERLTKNLNEYREAHHVKNRKSQLIGCSTCGSKINKEYVKENNCCPACCSSFYSSTDTTRIQGYLNNIDKWKKAYKRLNVGKEKYGWYIHTKHH